MGDPKRNEKHYEIPRKHWDLPAITKERGIMETYGLKNKRELRRLQHFLKGKRHNARGILALPLEQRTKRQDELMKSLKVSGLLPEHATLDDVLILSIEEMLERRLQTFVMRKALANTISEARQLIVHGHIAVNGKKIDKPGYMVHKGEEEKISYYGKFMQLKAGQKSAKQEKEAAETAEKVENEAPEESTLPGAEEGAS